MRKFPYLAVTILSALLLAACSAPTVDPTTEGGVPTTPVTTIPVSPVVPNTTHPESTAPIPEETESMTLVENDNITVKITGTENDPIWGYTVNVFLENKTDKELLFTVDNVSINRYMCDPFWAESVAAGMKSNSSISWFESEFEENGINIVKEISFTLRVYDSKNFSAEDIFQGSFTIRP